MKSSTMLAISTPKSYDWYRDSSPFSWGRQARQQMIGDKAGVDLTWLAQQHGFTYALL
jgi:hypothetical protein